jgi:hypothetical protein
MNSFFKAIIAGWGAKKLGGGCLSTVVIFIVIYTLLGKCDNTSRAASRPEPSKVERVQQQKPIKALKPKAVQVYCKPNKTA